MRRAIVIAALAALTLAPAASADVFGLVVGRDGERRSTYARGPDGVFTSDSTRLRGLVTGRDLETGNVEIVPDDDPAATVQRLDDRIEWNDRWRTPLTFVLAAAVIGLALVRPSWGLRALLLALAANLWLSPLLALAAGLAAVALPLGLACAAVLAVYLASMGLDPETVALSPLGPSQVNRFYGINNLLETMLLAPALVGAALLGRTGVLVAGLALVTVGGNRFGADGGGIVVLAVAYLVLWWRLRGARPERRHLLLALGAVVVLLALDVATGGSSHVTDALGDGPVSLAGDLADRIERSVTRTAGSPGAIAVVLGALAVLAVVVARAPRTPLLVAYLAGLGASLVVNDTPSDVLGAGAAIAVALACYTGGVGGVSSAPMRRAALLLALLALSAGVAGCGGGEDETATPETVAGSLPEDTTEADTGESAEELPEGNAEAGGEVFAANGCGSCHTFQAAGSSGSVGPNLDESSIDYEGAFTTIKNGRGGMPSFEGQLSDQQIADVAAYVTES